MFDLADDPVAQGSPPENQWSWEGVVGTKPSTVSKRTYQSANISRPPYCEDSWGYTLAGLCSGLGRHTQTYVGPCLDGERKEDGRELLRLAYYYYGTCYVRSLSTPHTSYSSTFAGPGQNFVL